MTLALILVAVPLVLVVLVETRRYHRQKDARLRLLDVIERGYRRESL